MAKASINPPVPLSRAAHANYWLYFPSLRTGTDSPAGIRCCATDPAPVNITSGLRQAVQRQVSDLAVKEVNMRPTNRMTGTVRVHVSTKPVWGPAP